jgi:hypothetical protein
MAKDFMTVSPPDQRKLIAARKALRNDQGSLNDARSLRRDEFVTGRMD